MKNTILSAVRAALRWLLWLAVEARGWVSLYRARFRSADQAIRILPEGPVALGPRVALFVHFDGRGAVRPYVLNYLKALKAAGLSIVFVTNSGRLQQAALEALAPLCDAVMIRGNVGYDFGAMREALARLALPRPDTELLLIANDSLYGPWAPLGDMLDRIDFAEADFWGATESWQRRYHLQSFFLAFGRTAMASQAWRDFWAGVRPVQSKYWIVSRYEIGLTQTLLRGGLRCAALWSYHALLQRVDASPLGQEEESEDPFIHVRRIQISKIRHAAVARVALNPTAELWRQLIEAGFPFIKRELLRTNPAKIIDIVDWQDVIRARSPAGIDEIERDLRLALRDKAG